MTFMTNTLIFSPDQNPPEEFRTFIKIKLFSFEAKG